MTRISSPRTAAARPLARPHPPPRLYSRLVHMPSAPRRASPSRDRPHRFIGRQRTPCQSRQRRCRIRPRPLRTLRISRRRCPRTRRASRPRRPPPHRAPRPESCRRPSRPSHSRTRPSRPRRSRRRMRDQTRPSSSAEVGGAMGPCTSCARRVVAHRGMEALSAAQGSRRRASSYHAVEQGASCREPPGLPPPPPLSHRLKSDCRRRHKAAIHTSKPPRTPLLIGLSVTFWFSLSPSPFLVSNLSARK